MDASHVKDLGQAGLSQNKGYSDRAEQHGGRRSPTIDSFLRCSASLGVALQL